MSPDGQPVAGHKARFGFGSEISSCMEISPWKHSGELKEAAIEQPPNCGMGRAVPGFIAQFRIGN